jgi:two-component system cell cycle sensor histidine kinase PleC
MGGHHATVEATLRAEARRVKSAILGNVSHDLRTPLNAILGYAEILTTVPDLDPEERGDMVARILSNALALTCSVNNLLEYSAVVTGETAIRPGRVVIEELFEEIEPTVRWLIDDKPVTFAWQVAPGMAPVETDRGKLRHAVLNLLANAVRYTPAGRIELSAVPAGAGVEIAVSDTGVGMSAGELAGAFETFRPASTPYGRPIGGIGLGLPLARRLCELLGGSLAVESAPARGTRVALRVPAVSPPVHRAAAV